MTKPMLAVAADFTKIRYPVYASPKLDGIRCLIIDGVAKTRTLKNIPNKHVAAILSRPEFTGLDGELIVGLPTSATCYTDTVSNVMAHDKEPDFTYYVFDIHDSVQGYDVRRASLHTLYSQRLAQHKFIKGLEAVLIANEADLILYEARCVLAGYEGIIVRAHMTAPYKFGRSTVNEGHLLKVKRFEDSEAEIIGFEEEMFNGNVAETNELGRTKRSTASSGLVGKNTLGAFTVRDTVSGVEFSVGTGLTAADRADFWARRDQLLGSLICYKFFPVGVKDRPRHPVYKGFRDRADL